MNEAVQTNPKSSNLISSVLYTLSVVIVVVGLMNGIPGISGLDNGIRSLTGLDWISVRKFPTEWFYPIMFSAMMMCVVLKHSIRRAWQDRGRLHRNFGTLLDVLLVLAALTISLTYVVEIESICLIDQFTGERVRLIAESLTIEAELAELYGLPEPTSVDDPKCVGNTGGWLVLIVGTAVLIFLVYNVSVL